MAGNLVAALVQSRGDVDITRLQAQVTHHLGLTRDLRPLHSAIDRDYPYLREVLAPVLALPIVCVHRRCSTRCASP